MENTIISGNRPIKKPVLKLIFFNWLKRKFLVEFICFFFVFLFIYAAAWKIMDYNIFYKEIFKLPLNLSNTRLPLLHKVAGKLIPLLIAVEVLSGILLAVPRTRLKGLYFTISLMLVLNGYLLAVLHFSKEIPLFFGGILPKITLEGHITFSLIVLFIALGGFLLYSKQTHTSS